MAEQSSGFQLADSGPGAYERYMVPAHCERRSHDLLSRVHLQPREHVLDIACGTGVVARHAARRVGDSGRVVGVELNHGMLEVARHVSQYHDPIEYLVGDAGSLPVPDSSFDVALCQHSFMFFPDRESAAREMHRALKPGGRVGVSVFRTLGFNPAFEHLVTVLEQLGNTEAAGFMRSPFVFEQPSQLRTVFEQAGFRDIGVTIRIETLRYPSVSQFVRNETFNIPDPALHTNGAQAALVAAMDPLVADYVDDDGVVFPSQDFVLVASR